MLLEERSHRKVAKSVGMFSTLWCLAPVGTMVAYGFKAGSGALPWSLGKSKEGKGGRAVVFSRHVVGMMMSMW